MPAHNLVRFAFIAAVLLRIPIFWNMTLCRWVSSSRQFEGTRSLRDSSGPGTCLTPEGRTE